MALRRDPIAFPTLDERQVSSLSHFATLKSFEPEETLFAAGERDFRFFVVKSGEIAIIDRSADYDELVAVHKAGEFTGDVDMLTGRPVLVSAIARTGCEVYEISAEVLRDILNELPSVSDTLLAAFLMRRELMEASGFTGVRVIGSRYSKDTHRIREFLAKNRVPFTWFDLERDPTVEALLAHFEVAADETPVVVCSGNKVLRNPATADLASCLGIRRPLSKSIYDLAIVGAGPAGLAAAVYGASEGFKTLLLDKTGPGGQAGTSSKIENYMGFPTGLSGSDLANRAVLQAEKFGATLSAPAEVASLHSDNGYHALELSGGEEVPAKCIVIAAGAAYRKLDVDGCERFEGSGVYYAATAMEAQLCGGAEVVIVGGGNSAGQAAIYLAERARRVRLVILGESLSKTMSHYLERRIEQTPNIEVHHQTQISRMLGDASLAAVELTCARTGRSDAIDCQALFVFIGSTPHTQWLPEAIQTDAGGFIKAGAQVADWWALRRQPFLLETSRPGIFAAGDARRGSTKRVASAVGEGAMAVQFAHQYLASS